MTRHILTAVVAICVTAGTAQAQSGFGGTWVTTDFPDGAHNFIVLDVQGTSVSGTIYQAIAAPIENGRVNLGVVTFTATGAQGNRVVTYTGKLNGNQIHFTRSVKVLDPAFNNGNGIFGAMGPMEFIARRSAPLLPVLTALLGNWHQNVQKSTYEPGPPPAFRVPLVQQFTLRVDGGLGLMQVGVNGPGAPQVTLGTIRTDGKPYALYTNPAALRLAEGQQGSPTWTSRVVNHRTLESTTKNPNGNTVVLTRAVSSDGRSYTTVRKVFNPQGQLTVTETLLFERPQPQAVQ